MTDSTSTPATARAQRQQAREGQRLVVRLKLLEDSGLLLVRAASLSEAQGGILALACGFTGVEHAALLAVEAGQLVVQAMRGPLVPPGSRLPIHGAYAAVLQRPLQPLLREQIASPLLAGRGAKAASEWLLPLALAGEPLGALALLSLMQPAPPPDATDLQTLTVLGTSLAATLASLARGGAAVTAAPAELQRLTPRERQVLSLLPRGLTNAELGEALGIAAGTAKAHVERILFKLGLSDRTSAAVRATEWGLKA